MTTTIIHDNVIGTEYQASEFEVSKMRATRKLIIKSTRSNIDNDTSGGAGTSIMNDLRGVTGSPGSYTTLLGPLWNDPVPGAAQQTDYEIVHPDNNSLPLQAINIAKMGDQRYLVTLSYFVVAGAQGGGAQATAVCQLRTEFYSKRIYTTLNKDGERINLFKDKVAPGTTAGSLGRVVTLPQVKVQIPFSSYNSPATTSAIMRVGQINSEAIRIAVSATGESITFPADSLRYDGIQMTQYGSVVNSGGTVGRYKGFVEFTARGDKFLEESLEIPDNNKPQLIEMYPNVADGNYSDLTSDGIPTG